MWARFYGPFHAIRSINVLLVRDEMKTGQRKTTMLLETLRHIAGFFLRLEFKNRSFSELTRGKTGAETGLHCLHLYMSLCYDFIHA